jgi:hypothetical protein
MTGYEAVTYDETYTGRRFFPLAPTADSISIIDIAHHLSSQCRYAGATKFGPGGAVYSVAQHSVLLATYAATILKASAIDTLQILMHDAPEAYLIDIPRPIKQQMLDYRKWEHTIDSVIREWLGISGAPKPTFQDEIDSRIIVDERAQLLSDSGNDWKHSPKHGIHPLGITIVPWTAQFAEQQFLFRYAAYTYYLFKQHQYLRSDWSPDMPSRYTPFKTLSTDARPWEDGEPTIPISYDLPSGDLVEVDLRGGVGRIKLRSENGMLVRNTDAGTFPMPAFKWMHGKFTLTETQVAHTPSGATHHLSPVKENVNGL